MKPKAPKRKDPKPREASWEVKQDNLSCTFTVRMEYSCVTAEEYTKMVMDALNDMLNICKDKKD